MLTISKPLSAAAAHRYHAEAFQNARENYYTATEQIRGRWHGQLARAWGLRGEVGDEPFRRLAEGQHPMTGEQLVRHQTAHAWTNRWGKTVHTMAHRAGWDLTFSTPKSVSLTALVGGDARVQDAHRASVAVALDETEPYVQARVWHRPAETTGHWIAAWFEHDSARPVEGYAAPHLHTHAVVFNLTQTANGDVRALQPRELYKTQSYATAVYRSALARQLTLLGYEIERGPSGQPEIRGYTQAYLEASSPRRQQIQAYLAKTHQHGAAAAHIANHRTRNAKIDCPREEMQRRHRALAAAYDEQPAKVLEAAQKRQQLELDSPRATAHEAVTFARDRNFEREAVVDQRTVLRDALARSMGDRTPGEIKAEFEQRVETGEFVALARPTGSPGRAVTMRERIDLDDIARNERYPRSNAGRRRGLRRETLHRSASEPNRARPSPAHTIERSSSLGHSRGRTNTLGLGL